MTHHRLLLAVGIALPLTAALSLSGCTDLLEKVTQAAADAGVEITTEDGFVGIDFSNVDSEFSARVRVIGPDGPLSTAYVELNGVRYNADADGIITLDAIKVFEVTSVQVGAPGFVVQPLSISISQARGEPLTIRLTKADIQGRFSASIGTCLATGSAEIVFPKDGYVRADGTLYTGDVQISMTSIDPQTELFDTYSKNGTEDTFTLRTDFDSRKFSANMLIGRDTDGFLNFSPPESIVSVSLTDADGNKLQIRPGKRAQVALGLTSFTYHQVGDVIPMWTQDAEGLWKAEGTCEVRTIPAARQTAGRTLECVGRVSHFSNVAVRAKGKFDSGICVEYDVTITGAPKLVSPDDYLAREQFADQAATDLGGMGLASLLGRSGSFKAISFPKAGGAIVNVGLGPYMRSITKVSYFLDLENPVSDGDNPDSRPLKIRLFVTPWKKFEKQACVTYTDSTPCVKETVTFNWGDAPDLIDADGDGAYVLAPGATGDLGAAVDCDDTNDMIYPGAPEPLCSSYDRDCSGAPGNPNIMPTDVTATVWNKAICNSDCAPNPRLTEIAGNAYDEDCQDGPRDKDNDGFLAAADPARDPNQPADCDDARAEAVGSGGTEVPGNMIDEDCNGFMIDADGDGFVARGTVTDQDAALGLPSVLALLEKAPDCDDGDPKEYPGNNTDIALEAVFKTEFFTWTDGRVYGKPSLAELADANGLTMAGRARLRDVNCDKKYSDLDGDGHTVPGDHALGAENADDCDDLNPVLINQPNCEVPEDQAVIWKGAAANSPPRQRPDTPFCTEDDTTCDGNDDDCDGQFDEDFLPGATSCKDGGCNKTGMTSCVNGSVTSTCAASTTCVSCDAGFFGANCTACTCQTGANCADGVTGDGACSCPTGTFGANCTSCSTCPSNATCDEGIGGTGCQCNANHFGPNCDACNCSAGQTCMTGIAGAGCVTVGCTAGQYTCADGGCIQSAQKCDTTAQCTDGSDETVGAPANCGCPAGQYQCANNTCVAMSALCNGVNDCGDASDEGTTPPGASPTMYFLCLNATECIPQANKCDGSMGDGHPNDCSDNSDENPGFAGCPAAGPCSGSVSEFECTTGSECVPPASVCDGVSDCADGSDEAVSPTPSFVCEDDGFGALMFRCANGTLRPSSVLCDMSNDCGDNSDEDSNAGGLVCR